MPHRGFQHLTLSQKLAQQQLLKSRNEARFSLVPVAAIHESVSGLPASEPSAIQSGLKKLQRRFQTPPPDLEPSVVSVPNQPYATFAGAVEGDGGFLRRVSHSPFGL